MSHDHVSVKAEGSVDTDLGVVTTEEGGQPATLSSVHQQEHHVMVLDQLLQSLHLLGHLVHRLLCEGVCVCVCVRNSLILFRLTLCSCGVSGHWDAKLHPLSIHFRKDQLQTLSSCHRLLTTTTNTVLVNKRYYTYKKVM